MSRPRRAAAALLLAVVVLFGCDASENFAKDGPRLKAMVAMVQAGRIKLDPQYTNLTTQRVPLPAELKGLCRFDEVSIATDENTHALTEVSCQQSGGCMGDCSTEYVYVVGDNYKDNPDGGVVARRIEKNWFWVEEHR